MANISTNLSIRFKDALGVPSSVFLYGQVPDTTTLAALATAWGAGITAVAGISDAGFVSATAEIVVGSLASVTPADDSESERGGLFNYDPTGGKYPLGLWIPSLKPALVVGGKINLGDSLITALNTFMNSGSGALTITNQFLIDIVGLRDASEAFRKLRRRAEKLTKVIVP